MNAIAQHAIGLIGTPFRHQGRNPSVGLDCVGLWVECLKRSGVPVRDHMSYRRFPDGRILRAKLLEQFREVTVAQPGDLLILRVPRSKLARHVGVFIGEGKMIHANADRKMVMRERVNWDKVDGVFRAEVPNG